MQFVEHCANNNNNNNISDQASFLRWVDSFSININNKSHCLRQARELIMQIVFIFMA